MNQSREVTSNRISSFSGKCSAWKGTHMRLAAQQLNPPPTHAPQGQWSSAPHSLQAHRGRIWLRNRAVLLCTKNFLSPPKIAAINSKTLWPQANYEAANHCSTPCLHHPALMTCPNNFHMVTFWTKIFQSPWKWPDRQKHGN